MYGSVSNEGSAERAVRGISHRPPSPEELARQQEALAALAAQQQEQLRRQQLLEQMGQ